MREPEPFDVERAQHIREDLIAPAIKELQEMAEAWPEHGQHLVIAENHFRAGFMELGYGMAVTNGLDPLANKVNKAE